MRPRHLLASLPLAAALLLYPAGAAASGGVALAGVQGQKVHTQPVDHLRQIVLTRIGHPTWEPVDFHLFSAPIGTSESGYAEFLTTTVTVLPAPNHRVHPELGVGPGVPHRPPYHRELRDGVVAAGFEQNGPFTLSDFSNGNGIWLAWMNVPRPGTRGSSPDFRRGPIISNELFPIQVSGYSTHRGQPFDPLLVDFAVPKLDTDLDPPFTVDGHSHFPVFIADNTDFGPPDVDPLGGYSYHVRMVDQDGNGWRVKAHFVVRS